MFTQIHRWASYEDLKIQLDAVAPFEITYELVEHPKWLGYYLLAIRAKTKYACKNVLVKRCYGELQIALDQLEKQAIYFRDTGRAAEGKYGSSKYIDTEVADSLRYIAKE